MGSTSQSAARYRLWPTAAVVFGLGLVLLLVPGLTGSAAGQSGESIQVRHSAKCLAVQGGSGNSGASVVQTDCNGSASQSWTTADAGGGYLELRVGHTGMCMTVSGASNADVAPIVQAPCGAGSHQQFQAQATEAGWGRYLLRHSGKCLDITGASQANGAQLIQYTCHGGANQELTLITSSGNPAVNGRWGPVINTPLVPAAASALPNGKVLLWSAYGRFTFGGDRGYTQTALFDPASGTTTERQVSNTGHDMFCPGIANLADGRILVNGGSSAAETSIYDPSSDTWEDGADMNVTRGYNATTLLSDGSAFTLGGSWSGGAGGKLGEVWSDDTGWQTKPGIPAAPFEASDPQGVYRGDNHMWLFAWSDGTVFHAGPKRQMHWIDTAGSGSYAAAGNRANDPYAINGNAVMYEPGKILTAGGAPAYQNQQATANGSLIDITGSTVASRQVGSMSFRRGFHSSTLLPDGQVVVTGGQRVPIPFSDADAVLATEIWDADTETFRTVAPMSVPRTYHSFGILLPDARVMVGGGGLCGGCATNHPDVQIYSPPYLFNNDGSEASRPGIVSAPTSVDLNERFEVRTNRNVSEFSLVRLASATHAVNNDQRRIPLDFTPGSANLSYRLQMPSDGGIAIPGGYMLFAIDSNGVPSLASTLTVTTDQAPDVTERSIEGVVAYEDGTPAAGVSVDLFEQVGDGGRGQFLTSTQTDAQGRYRFEGLEARCYVQTFVAPDGETFDGSRWYQPATCIEVNDAVTLVNATLDGGPGSPDTLLAGTVTFSTGAPASGVAIDLFEATASGDRGAYLASTTTDASGDYEFEVSGGCYITTMIAPAGASFGGSQWFQPGACVDPGQQVGGIDGVLTSTAGQSSIGGVIALDDGSPVAGALVDLFEANADGSRGQYLSSARSNGSGAYELDTDPGCRILTFTALAGMNYGGSRWFQPGLCVDPGNNIDDLNATLSLGDAG